MKVWVVMGNDYPSGVFGSEEAASIHIDKQKDKEDEQQKTPHRRRISWRSYEFTLDGEV